MYEKTYVLLTNSFRSGRKEPYSPFVFQSRGIVKRWKEIQPEYDLVFATAQELADICDQNSLNGIYTTLCAMEGVEPQVGLSAIELAKAVFSWTTKRAQRYTPHRGVVEVTSTAKKDELDEITDSALKASKSTKGKSTKKEASVKGEKVLRHKVYGNDQKIKRLLDDPPIKPGSNRYRNMQTVMNSKTVGEALQRLKALKPAGVPFDIDIAVQKKAIEIE